MKIRNISLPKRLSKGRGATMDAQPEPDQVTEAEYGNARDDHTLERQRIFTVTAICTESFLLKL
jgi:hypothetical protein